MFNTALYNQLISMHKHILQYFEISGYRNWEFAPSTQSLYLNDLCESRLRGRCHFHCFATGACLMNTTIQAKCYFLTILVFYELISVVIIISSFFDDAKLFLGIQINRGFGYDQGSLAGNKG